MMLKMVLVAIVLGVATAQQCGHPAITPNPSRFHQLIKSMSKAGDRIVGGTEARAHSWPWQVAFLTSSGQQVCGGSIINNNWVLTAAHCCYSTSPSSFRVRVGAHNLQQGESSAATLPLSRIVVHPNYVGNPVPVNDFCLVKLTSPIVYTSEVSPVCLATADDGPVGQKCWVTGWGTTGAAKGSFADFIAQITAEEQGLIPAAKDTRVAALRQVDVVVSNQQTCNSAYGGLISSDMICAASPGKDSCQGDSGGPLVCQDASGAYKLVGVVSWGRGCAQAGYPGVYARTSSALAWILATAV